MTRSWVNRVHAIVRDEFEDCRSWKDPGQDCVVVKHVDMVAEKEVRASNTSYLGFITVFWHSNKWYSGKWSVIMRGMLLLGKPWVSQR